MSIDLLEWILKKGKMSGQQSAVICWGLSFVRGEKNIIFLLARSVHCKHTLAFVMVYDRVKYTEIL